jgi:hypothetical protein
VFSNLFFTFSVYLILFKTTFDKGLEYLLLSNKNELYTFGEKHKKSNTKTLINRKLLTANNLSERINNKTMPNKSGAITL